MNIAVQAADKNVRRLRLDDSLNDVCNKSCCDWPVHKPYYKKLTDWLKMTGSHTAP